MTKEELKEWNKKYYQANREKILKYNKERNKENKEAISEYMKGYSKQYYESNKKKKLEYYQTNKDKKMAYCKVYFRNRRAADPAFRLICSLRVRHGQVLKGVSSTTKGLGCDSKFFRKYIENQWTTIKMEII